MKINIGDVFITAFGNSILVVDVLGSGMVKGIYGGETEVKRVGYEEYIRKSIHSGDWKHYPVKK